MVNMNYKWNTMTILGTYAPNNDGTETEKDNFF